jgi:UDP-N-acetylglucosamine acyltransferase
LKSSEVQKLKEAYRLLLRSGLALEEALARIADARDPYVDHLTNFIRASTRGFSRE